MFWRSRKSVADVVDRDTEQPEDRGGAAGPQDPKRERRRTIRHKVKVLIELVVKARYGASGDWSVNAIDIKGRLLDLSLDGAMIYTRENFEREQELRLTVFIPKEPPVKTLVQVRWCKAIPKKKAHASGVKFTMLSGKGLDIIESFLEELDEQFGA